MRTCEWACLIVILVVLGLFALQALAPLKNKTEPNQLKNDKTSAEMTV